MTRGTRHRGAEAIAIIMLCAGLVLWVAALLGHQVGLGWIAFAATYGLITFGSIGWIVLKHHGTHPGIKNDGVYHRSAQRGGVLGWMLVILLGAFYAAYYVDSYIHGGPHYLAAASRLLDPLSHLMRGTDQHGNPRGAHHWFLYGYLYSLFVVVFSIRMFYRFRHDRYQKLRTASVLIFQLLLAFLLPYFLEALQHPVFYFSYFWPLAPQTLYPSEVASVTESHGGWGSFMVMWSLACVLVATPVLTYFFGKRWYCSWVCGCGGLAETAGDPFRHLSNKSTAAWRFEIWSIHTVLAGIVSGTALLWINAWTGAVALGRASAHFQAIYGFVVVSMLAGALGTALYPVLGSRVWCRFFCPMAAILGILQKHASRFRISSNGGQCMSCGNCSTYCEMGINVRSYAQKGQNVVRASCVGCGMCAAVCPRGVLHLENGKSHRKRSSG